MSKLTRTQIMLDPKTLQELKPDIDSQNLSLASYIRNLMDDKVKQIKKTNQKKRQKLLASAGTIRSNGSGTEALDHNDIYKI